VRRVLAALCIGALATVGAVRTPARAQTAARRAIALVVDVDRPPGTSPLFGPDGKTAPDAADTIAELRQRVAALASAEDMPPYALKLSPVLCDELQLVGSEQAQALLAELASLASGRPVVGVPYTDVRFADVSAGAIAREIEDGTRALGACTRGRDPIDVLATSDLGVPDADRLDVLAEDGPGYLLSGYAFPSPRDRPDDPPSRAGEGWPRPVAATAQGPDVTADDVLAERPGAGRLVVVVELDRRLPDTFGSLADDDRLVLRGLPSFLDPKADFPEGRIYAPEPLSSRYERAVREARAVLDDLRSYTLDGNRLVRVFGTVLAEASASADPKVRTSARVQRMLGALAQEIRDQFALVSLSEGSVTFTSRRGSVPVTVSNRATYPVRVRVSLQSSKLSFPHRTIVRNIEPPGDTITFAANAESSGTFVVTAVVKSDIKRYGTEITLDAIELTVRSTAANLPVLILTIAGALLLLVVYAGRISRRRRSST
jgi:hypothetical protein